MPMRPPSCLPALSRPPARHGTASSIDCLADASYNESKCAMRNIQLWRKPAPQNEMEEPMPFAEGQQGRLYWRVDGRARSEEHTSELQSLMRISYAVFCLQKKNK